LQDKTALARLIRNARERKEGSGPDLISKAYDFTEKEFSAKEDSHKKEKDYLAHAASVAEMLFDRGFDSITIAAGMLHEVEEKAGTVPEKIRAVFGAEIEEIVTDYTKIKKIEERNIGKISNETLSTVILATAKDLRSIFIKLATRLGSMKNDSALSKEELLLKAQGAMHIYAPICQKLGLYELQSMLEDSSLKIIEPAIYGKIKSLIGKTIEERNIEIENAIAEFSNLAKEKKGVVVQGRVKSIYSIYEKMQKQGKQFEEIYDLLGIRLICGGVKECYELLGIVHSEYKITPNQFNDYIANPKKNGYMSIHTVVLWNNQPVEVQIRTLEMHYEDETGLAAHWQYKQYAQDRFFDKRLALAKQLVEWHRTARDSNNLAHSLKMGFGQNNIFVFTPKQQVIVLPEGSSPIDFAFAIHSDLGKKCFKAKINGKIVQLHQKLENGDLVEIMTAKQPQVKRQWLGFVKSQKAQAKIRQVLGIKPARKKIIEKKSMLTSSENIKIAKCCNPVPGDDIAGMRTTKRKISVHRVECENLAACPKSKRVEVKWGLAEKDYLVGIKVKAKDSPALLPAVLKIIGGNAAIVSTFAKAGKGSILQCRFNLKIKNSEQLERIISKINALPLVLEAERE